MKKKLNRKIKPVAYLDPDRLEAGLDEAGRGCLAGPVFAASVILPKDFANDLLKDSKLLSAKRRYALRDIIQENALAWGIGMADEHEIDIHNVANASYIAMHRAVRAMRMKPEILLVDGKYFNPYDLHIPYTCIVEGDAKFAAIAAASILAKTYRDDYMVELTPQYPEYEWDINKGYPTKRHRAAIQNLGSTPHHRKSFKLLPDSAFMKDLF
jgi:ribonuclease HII